LHTENAEMLKKLSNFSFWKVHCLRPRWHWYSKWVSHLYH